MFEEISANPPIVQVAFVAGIQVEVALGDAELVGDIFHPRPAIAVAGEDFQGYFIDC